MGTNTQTSTAGTGGLFGSTQTNTAAGGGLFGAQNQNKSLFGGATATASTGGFTGFGTNTPSTSLFGQNAQQQKPVSVLCYKACVVFMI
jgi:hypothetical protein